MSSFTVLDEKTYPQLNTANYAVTTSVALTATTANFATLATTASYATTAGYTTLAITANYATTANYALQVSTNYVTNNYYSPVTINSQLYVIATLNATTINAIKLTGDGSNVTRSVLYVLNTNKVLNVNNSLILVDGMTATRNITLPDPITCPGKQFTIKKMDASIYAVQIAGVVFALPEDNTGGGLSTF